MNWQIGVHRSHINRWKRMCKTKMGKDIIEQLIEKEKLLLLELQKVYTTQKVVNIKKGGD